MLVPSMVSVRVGVWARSLSAADSEPAASAAVIISPGAEISGFSRPSRVGPRLEKRLERPTTAAGEVRGPSSDFQAFLVT